MRQAILLQSCQPDTKGPVLDARSRQILLISRRSQQFLNTSHLAYLSLATCSVLTARLIAFLSFPVMRFTRTRLRPAAFVFGARTFNWRRKKKKGPYLHFNILSNPFHLRPCRLLSLITPIDPSISILKSQNGSETCYIYMQGRWDAC